MVGCVSVKVTDGGEGWTSQKLCGSHLCMALYMKCITANLSARFCFSKWRAALLRRSHHGLWLPGRSPLRIPASLLNLLNKPLVMKIPAIIPPPNNWNKHSSIKIPHFYPCDYILVRAYDLLHIEAGGTIWERTLNASSCASASVKVTRGGRGSYISKIVQKSFAHGPLHEMYHS